MTKYSKEQRARIVESYFTHDGSLVAVQRDFMATFNQRTRPSKHCIIAIISKFRESGSTADKERSGRPRTVRNACVTQRVSNSIQQDPRTSTRKRSSQLGISRRSVQRILTKDLKLYPYKIQLTHELHSADHQKRKEFSRAFLELANDETFISHLIMSDEAHFHISGYVNKQNCRFWCDENPRIIHEQSLHPQKVTVWCGITSARIIGPYFFEDDGVTTTVTGNNYRQMLQRYLLPQLEDLEMHNMWFQQDGATPHTARETMTILREAFPGKVISRSGDVSWPPRSPDLTPPDFFLWGYLKERVYINKPNTLSELKVNITEEIKRITPCVLEKVMESTVKRMRTCLDSNGQHLKDVIFEN